MTTVQICCFSAGLDDLTRKQQADHVEVLKVLARTERFSVFEATNNHVIAQTMGGLLDGPLLKRTGGAYPWVTCELTEAGKRLIGESA